jgi:hypothetical protein
MTETSAKYRCIGKGFCGTVCALDGGYALKREDGGPGRSLQNDFDMHLKLLEASSAPTIIAHIGSPVAIPQVQFIS